MCSIIKCVWWRDCDECVCVLVILRRLNNWICHTLQSSAVWISMQNQFSTTNNDNCEMVKWTMAFFSSLIEKPKLLSYLLNGLKFKQFENENHEHTHTHTTFESIVFTNVTWLFVIAQTCSKQKLLFHARLFSLVRFHSGSVSLDAFQSWKQMKANFLAIQHSVTMICYKRERDLVIVAHSYRRTVRTIYRRFLGFM